MSYQSIVREVNLATGQTDRAQFVHDRVVQWNDTFKEAHEYEQVKLTLNDTIDSSFYDIWLYANSSYKELVDMKTVIFAPGTNESAVFSGQYMRLQARDNRPEELFMIVSDDKQYETKIKAMVDECTETLRWYDEDGNLREYPVVIMNSYLKSLNEDRYMVLTNGKYVVGMPQNEVTKKLNEGAQFILNNKHKYRIGGFEDIESSTFMTVHLEKYEENSEGDNLELGIANYSTRPTFTISTNDDTINLTPSSIVQTEYSLLDRNNVQSDKPVKYTSSNELICTISDTGEITGVAVGSTTVRIEMENNANVFTDVNIVVADIIPDNISYDVSPDGLTVFRRADNTYTVQKLNNNVEESEIFTITMVSNTLESGRFEFELIGNNGFRLKNNGTVGEIVIRILPNSRLGDVFERTYKFSGSYS